MFSFGIIFFIMKSMFLLCCAFNSALTVTVVTPTAKPDLPIVLWHGIGDTCCLPITAGQLRLYLINMLPGINVTSLQVGTDNRDALERSYNTDPNIQVEYACTLIEDNKHLLQNGFNMIGLGQGSLFLRAVIQRCGHKLPPIRTYISFGGPQRGIYGLPRCISLTHETCHAIMDLLEYAPYHSMTQRSVVPASYWNDPTEQEEYKENSIFLADINNERTVNETYRRNLKKLKHFVMVKFEFDSVIEPIQSEWFGYYAPGQMKQFLTLQESDIYLEDRLGLKEMDRDGKLVFLSQPADHLEFDGAWLVEYIKPYLVGNYINNSPKNRKRDFHVSDDVVIDV